MAKKIEAEQPAYGQAGVLDAAEQSLQEATPVPPPTEGALAVQEAVSGEQPPTEEIPANAASQGQAQPAGFTVRNRFNLLPSRVNFQAAQQPKTDVEQKYDAGLMFQVLGDDGPLKIIADELLGR